MKLETIKAWMNYHGLELNDLGFDQTINDLSELTEADIDTLMESVEEDRARDRRDGVRQVHRRDEATGARTLMFDRYYRGLDIAFLIEEYDRGVHTYPNGDPGYPPSGGGCEHWEVDDIDDPIEFVEEISESWEAPEWWRFGSRIVRWMTLLMLRNYDRLTAHDQSRMRAIAQVLARRHWDEDICQACEEYYWDEVAGE